MSHGGGGGGGGFGHGGGHGGYSHGGHGGHINHGVHLGGGNGNHGGTVIGHILHNILHHGTHHHHMGVSAPDQSASWSMSMQGERGWSIFKRIDKRPFIILPLIFICAFTWLCVIEKLHHAEVKSASQSSVVHGGSHITGGIASGASAMPANSAHLPTASFPAVASSLPPAYPAGANIAPVSPGYGAYSAASTNLNAQSITAPAYGYVPGGQYSPDQQTVMGPRPLDRNSAISAPITYRHALGSGMLSPNYEPLASGRQRLVVSK